MTNTPVRPASSDSPVHLDWRIRSEFLEMPGLVLTPAQAARLWAVDRPTAERVLDTLVSAGFLGKTLTGAYLRKS